MKLIIEVTENYYAWLKARKANNKASVSDATILDGLPYEERPTGYWIKDCDSCDCSNCYDSGTRFTRKDCSGRCSNCGELQCCTDNYCPNCGAYMVKEE